MGWGVGYFFCLFKKILFLLRIHYFHDKSIHNGSSDRFLMVDPLNYFSFTQCPTTGVTGHGMCYPVLGMVHIKEPFLLIGKSSSCDGSRFPLLLTVVLYHITINKMY